MEKFYTYCLIDPRDCQPFYVGKGKGRRMYDHWKHRNAKCCKNYRLKQKLKQLEQAGVRPVYSVVLENVTDAEALSKEMELVACFGRLDIGTGILCNLTDGGEAGASGWSQDTRLRKSQLELAKNKGQPVNQYTLGGEFIASFPSAKRASEAVEGANRSYITQCCKKVRKSAGGFLWAYSSDNKPTYTHEYNTAIRQLTKDGAEVAVHRSVTEAANTVNRTPQAISACCRGKSATCAGFVWQYVE